MDALPPGVDPSTVPAGIPPPGVTPNLINPPSIAWLARLSIYVTLPFAAVSIILRVYVRLRVSHRFGMDDYLCIAAGITSFAYCGMIIDQMSGDFWGRHQWNMPLSILTPTLNKKSVALVLLYIGSAFFIKISLLTLYYRIFRPVRQAVVLVWLGVIIVALYSIVIAVFDLVVSVPHPGETWTSTAVAARAGRYEQESSVAQAIFGTVTDIYILVIPLAMILRLQLSTSRKVGIASIFMIGSLACAFSIMLIYYRRESTLANPSDFSYFATITESLGVVELNVGIVCGCAPVIFVLFKWPAAKFVSGWKSLTGYINSRTGRSRPSTSEDDLVVFEDPGLPGVRKGTLGSHDSATYYELRSVDYNYHAYVEGGVLKAGKRSKTSTEPVFPESTYQRE